ncbi:MAG: prepilin peptidase [Spirochaetales bacterium]|nr:prepilin peptidase [Spirochaetales bacterium]
MQSCLHLFILLFIAIPVSIIDWKTHRIPDLIIYPSIFAILILRFLFFQSPIYETINLLILGFLPFYFIRFFTKGKMGLGDAKYSAFLALFLGYENWFKMIFISSSTAVIFAVIGLKLGKLEKQSRIPFGPFLSLGAIISFFIQL